MTTYTVLKVVLSVNNTCPSHSHTTVIFACALFVFALFVVLDFPGLLQV